MGMYESSCGFVTSTVSGGYLHYQANLDEYRAGNGWDCCWGRMLYGNVMNDIWRLRGKAKSFTCPSDPTVLTRHPDGNRQSYAILPHWMMSNPGTDQRPKRLSLVKNVSAQYLVVESDYLKKQKPDQGHFKESMVGTFDDSSYTWVLSSHEFGPNHNNSASILYADGHARLKTTWKGGPNFRKGFETELFYSLGFDTSLENSRDE